MKTAVVTGASSGIGEATARRLADEGWQVLVGARRVDRLPTGPNLAAHALDVTDPASVAAFAAAAPAIVNLLVNNAGGALGLTPVAEADEEQWRWMYDANVLGTMRVTKALLPRLERSEDGHVVNIGSIAALEVYDGGAGYTAAKHALKAVTETLRLELNGRPVRVTEVDPGMVETEFSIVRFGGDEDRAAHVYRGLEPLTAEDVADAVVWAATRPSHVNVDQIVLKPTAQATAMRVHRRPTQGEQP